MSFKPAETVSGSKKLPLAPTITWTRISGEHAERMPTYRLGNRLTNDIGKKDG
jgi:hypothetical protein